MKIYLLFLLGLTCAVQGGRQAVCIVRPNSAGTAQRVSGTVTFSQDSPDSPVTVNVWLCGFRRLPAGANESDYLHGFHVHQTGNLTAGCDSAGGHYNPDGVNHGGPNDTVRHAGDFGNLRQFPNGIVRTSFVDKVATLYGDKSIIGRALVVHAGEDDLGRGGNPSSLANGNAGARYACCVIGYA